MSRAFDEVRAYGLECTVERICEATRKQFGSLCSLKKEDREYIALEVNKKTAVGELKDIVTQVLEAYSRENNRDLFQLPIVCGKVCAGISRELIAEEIKLVNQMMMVYKKLKYRER